MEEVLGVTKLLDLVEGDWVEILPGASLPKNLKHGQVRGYGTNAIPFAGRGILVDFGDIISVEYPFSTLMVMECHIKKV